MRGEVAGGEVLWVEATEREFSLGWAGLGDMGVATLPVEGRNTITYTRAHVGGGDMWA